MTTDEKLDRILAGQSELKADVAALNVRAEHLDSEVARLTDSFESHSKEDQRFFREMWPKTQAAIERIGLNDERITRLEDGQVTPRKQAGLAGGGGVIGALLWAVGDWLWRVAQGDS